MTEAAYVLVSINRSTPAAVARAIRQLDGVVDAHVTMGDYDVVAIAELEGTRGFPSLTAAVRRIDGVVEVATCVIIEP